MLWTLGLHLPSVETCCYYSLLQGGSVHLVLEFCCTDLAQVLQVTERPLTEAQLKCLMQQLLRGVAACHQAGEDCSATLKDNARPNIGLQWQQQCCAIPEIG